MPAACAKLFQIRKFDVAAGLEALVPVPVVQLTGLGLREDFVRLGGLAKPHLGLRVVGNVGVELPRKVPECFLDLPLAGPAGNAQNLVVITSCGRHAS
jgi:hypothetical protein